MFDWPEQNHTSPTTTSLNSTLFLPLTVNFAPVLVPFRGVNATDHLPPFAVVSAFCPANSTVTFSPSSAQPHTGTFWSRWRTMRSLKMTGSFTSAWADTAARTVRSASERFRQGRAGSCFMRIG